ncbi:MAG: hypothetical protein IPJ65_07440 [Archangiaceae bacterium]|nr:hypothetical protein [Archangiaceae bacterium]
MALKKMLLTVAIAVVVAVPAFASSRVEEALSLNSDGAAAKKGEKSKASKAVRVFDTLNTLDTQKTELPKNARHDATGGVFI